MYSNFCSQGCYNDFANKYVREVIAIAPRTEALETPIEVSQGTSNRLEQVMEIIWKPEIIAVDNNGG